MYSYDRIHKEKEKVDKSREKQYRLKKKKGWRPELEHCSTSGKSRSISILHTC